MVVAANVSGQDFPSVHPWDANGKGWFRRAQLLCLLALTLLLAACGKQELHSNLVENQANDMVSVLQNAGIDADKTEGEKSTFIVSVNKGDFSRAVDILRANGLPREEYATLCSTFPKGTYSSSAQEEHARLICALQQELTKTITQIDGVVEASVHLNIPMKEQLGEEQKASSASVFVKYRQGFDLTSKTGQIKTLVQNSVADLNPDNISVMMERAKAIPMAKKPFYQNGLLTLLMTIGAIIALIVLAMGLYRWWRSRPPKSTLPVMREDKA